MESRDCVPKSNLNIQLCTWGIAPGLFNSVVTVQSIPNVATAKHKMGKKKKKKSNSSLKYLHQGKQCCSQDLVLLQRIMQRLQCTVKN